MSLARSEGDYFKCERYVTVPAVDTIWRQIWMDKVSDFPKLASSAAHLFGHPRSFTESYAIYGRGMSLEQAKVGDGLRVRARHQFDIGRPVPLHRSELDRRGGPQPAMGTIRRVFRVRQPRFVSAERGRAGGADRALHADNQHVAGRCAIELRPAARRAAAHGEAARFRSHRRTIAVIGAAAGGRHVPQSQRPCIPGGDRSAIGCHLAGSHRTVADVRQSRRQGRHPGACAIAGQRAHISERRGPAGSCVGRRGAFRRDHTARAGNAARAGCALRSPAAGGEVPAPRLARWRNVLLLQRERRAAGGECDARPAGGARRSGMRKPGRSGPSGRWRR